LPAPATTFLKDALDKSYQLDVKQRVVVEWNMNRYADVIVADNFEYPEETYNLNPDIYPIMSIVEPNRPTTGLATARVDITELYDNYYEDPDKAIDHVADPNNKYKHWASPRWSQLTPVSGSYPIANAKPIVKYGTKVGDDIVFKSVKANKIVFTFELSHAEPVIWSAYIREGGDGDPMIDEVDSTPIAVNPTVDGKGRVVLYYQSDGTWSTSPGDYLTAPNCDITAIMASVTAISKPDHYLDVIEISPRIERNISDRVIDFSVTHDLGENDQISPIGIISSNTGSISLSNAVDGAEWPDPGYFETSDLFGPLDANVLFKIDYGIDTSGYSGGGFEYTRLATMYSEEWPISEDTISVDLKDYSKFLQEIKPNAMLFENLTVGQVIWRILNSVGMNNWKYTASADVANMRIAYFWTNPDETVWRNIQDLCRGTQSVAYFDEDGVFQIKTRDAAFALPDPEDIIEFRSDADGDLVPNIEEADLGDQFQVNHVTINYRPTKLAQDDLGRPISEIVWQPEDTVVLRSTSLAKSMGEFDKTMWIDQKDAVLWPYEGMLNIQGEIIKYVGKHYYYVTNTGAWGGLAVFNEEQKRALDNDPTRADVGQNWRNYFSGLIYITERGVGVTVPQPHFVSIPGWVANGGYYGLTGGTQTKWTGGMKYTPADGILRLITNKTFTNNHWYIAPRSTPGYSWVDTTYGTRLRFPTSPAGGALNCAGIFLYANAGNNNMYAIEVATTDTIEKNKLRAKSNEIRVLKRTGGEIFQIGGKGAAFPIVKGQWYDVEVRIQGINISVSVNGRVVLAVQDTANQIAPGVKCGIYVRGFTACDFEYFYALPEGIVNDSLPDETDVLSQIGGGYESKQFLWYVKANVSAYRYKKAPTWVRDGYRDRYIEEFGVPIHEVREYNVNFEKTPVLYSSLYISNSDQIVTTDYVGNPFGAQFTIANSSRINSVVNGEDTLTYGADNSVDQKMLITGRTIQQADEKEYIVKDDDAIRARGEITLEISSPWVQSETAAKALGAWIVNNWAEPADTLEMVVYGNPLVRVGDVTSVTYTPKGLTDAKFIVLSVRQSWDDGLQTQIICRKLP
jgi:hypothetical protein